MTDRMTRRRFFFALAAAGVAAGMPLPWARKAPEMIWTSAGSFEFTQLDMLHIPYTEWIIDAEL